MLVTVMLEVVSGTDDEVDVDVLDSELELPSGVVVNEEILSEVFSVLSEDQYDEMDEDVLDPGLELTSGVAGTEEILSKVFPVLSEDRYDELEDVSKLEVVYSEKVSVEVVKLSGVVEGVTASVELLSLLDDSVVDVVMGCGGTLVLTELVLLVSDSK